MPSTSAAQHRWIGYLHSNPEAREKAGLSAAAVSEWLHADKGKPWAHHANGGGIATHRDMGGGLMGGTPKMPPGQMGSPLANASVQRYAAMPAEKLQELTSRLGGTPQGQIVQKVLAQKRMQPQTANPAPQMQPAPQPNAMVPAQRNGGPVARAGGGSMGISPSQGAPWWTRSEASADNRPASGFLNGKTFGRQDSLYTSAPSGSYIIPADVTSGLGEGNSQAGARVIDEMLSTNPWGVASRGRRRAKGGGVENGQPERNVPVLLSHGEYAVPRDKVLEIGDGNLKRGHRILDQFVMNERAKHIKKLKSLPGPVKGSK